MNSVGFATDICIALMTAKKTWRQVAVTIYPPLHFGIKSKSKKQLAPLSLAKKYCKQVSANSKFVFFWKYSCRK